MPTITASEVLAGSKYTLDFNGVKQSRIFIVTCELSTTPTMMQYNAANAAGIPNIGDTHPTLTALNCRTKEAMPVNDSSPNIMKVICEYGYDANRSKNKPSTTGPTTLEFGTAMVSLKLYRDALNNPMILNYSDPISGTVKQQPAEFDVQAPMPTIALRRNEPLSQTDYIALKIAFEGHSNSTPWQGGLARTWMCTKISGKLQGNSFEVTYEFQYHGNITPFSWDGLAIYKEPSTKKTIQAGVPPLEVTFGNGGIQAFQIYPTADFHQLNVGG